MPHYTGSTTLANVEACQSITVTDGSLTIRGDVGSGAKITLESSQSGGSNQINFGNSIVVIGNNVLIGSTEHKLIVQGNIHDRVNIIGSSDMEFRGYLSDFIKVETKQGNIIVAGNVGSNTTLKSMSGNVSAGNVGSNTTLKSMSGNVSVLSRDSSATITTMSGKCYVNGRQENRRQNRSANVITSGINISSGSSLSSDTSNFGNFFSSGTTSIINGRVFINGVEQAVPTPTSRMPTTSQMRTTNRNTSYSSNENDMPAVLQSYINDFKEESFQDAFKRLAVDASDKYSFLSICCIISQDIPNIPVSLNGRLYDWDSLKSQIEKNGYKDPMTREMFTLEQVIPDRTTRDNLEGIIKKEEEMHKADIATASSPAFKQ